MTQLKLFVVIEDLRVIYQCDRMGEGLAFIAGRGAGVLSRVLTNPPKTKRLSKQPKSKTAEKNSQSRGMRKAS